MHTVNKLSMWVIILIIGIVGLTLYSIRVHNERDNYKEAAVSYQQSAAYCEAVNSY